MANVSASWAAIFLARWMSPVAQFGAGASVSHHRYARRHPPRARKWPTAQVAWSATAGPVLGQGEAAVERGLSAAAQQDAIALLPLEDLVDVVRRDRGEVHLVGEPFAVWIVAIFGFTRTV